MKLFSKKEVEVSKVIERDKQVVLGAQLANKVDGLRSLANKERENYDKQTGLLTEELLKFSNKINIERANLQSEVDKLKASRIKLTEPLFAEEQAIARKAMEVKERERVVTEKEKVVLERASEVSEKMDNLDNAKEVIECLEDSIKEREARVKRGEVQQVESSKLLTSEWERFNRECNQQNVKIEVMLRGIADRERVLAVKDEENRKATEFIASDRAHLRSQRQALEATKKEYGRN